MSVQFSRFNVLRTIRATRISYRLTHGLLCNSAIKICSNQPTTRLLCSAPDSINISDFQKYPNVFKYLEETQINWNGVIQNLVEKEHEKDEVLLLLKCCANAYPNQARNVRADICHQIWKNLQLDGTKLNINHYNSYLEICLENGNHVNFQEFVTSMKEKPSSETYKLLLENVCEAGDLNQALILLSVMKNEHLPVDERIFNCLVLCHTIHGGLSEGKNVIRTMKTAQIPQSEYTTWNLLRGLAKRKNKSEFVEVLENNELHFNEKHFFKVLSILSSNGTEEWLKIFKNSLNIEIIPREFITELENFCITLVHQNHAKSAVEIYCSLLPSGQNFDYGIFLLKEMLLTKQPIDTIINIAKDLKDRDINSLALKKITEIALIEKYFVEAWSLLESFDMLRPHYFWPLLISKSSEGEIGILAVLKRMLDLNVQPDTETLEFYSLKFCDLSKPNELLLKLEKLGLPKKQMVFSIVIALLQKVGPKIAYKFYADHAIAINDQKMYVILAKAWAQNNDTQYSTLLLQKMCESGEQSYDPVGTFLIHSFKNIRISGNFDQYLKLLNDIQKKNLRVSNTTSDELFNLLQKVRNYKELAKLEKMTEEITDIALRKDISHIPHPRDMRIDELECHLTELQSKNMDTRGVLRKLIQTHTRLKNYERSQELRKQFLALGYEESPGMMSSLFHSYVKSGNLTMSLRLYKEIKSSYKLFLLDDYKILDLAILMIQEDKFNDALNIIINESKGRVSKDTKAIERNCLELLNALKDSEQVNTLFTVLTKHNYCQPTNVILGPLIRTYLESNDIEKAVEKYSEFSEKYNSTPLQLEMLLEVVKEQNRHLLEPVLQATTKVHGNTACRSALLTALAENGLHAPLKKLLLDGNKLSTAELEKRYQRWISEEKLSALQTLMKASEGLAHLIEMDPIYLSTMKVFSLKNDCDSAVEFWKSLEEKEVVPSKELQEEYFLLLERCKYRTANTFVSNQIR